MTNYTEKDLESLIEAHLLNNGYIKRVSKDYDKNLCVDKELFLHFLKSSQKDSLEKLEQKKHRRARIPKRSVFTNKAERNSKSPAIAYRNNGR
ncbi:hypothetical protein [Campylobacter upsaliensis]|uniref:hypothetical protein n=1 Tax=Campylobacter upsaliensis TaxID=28080 RepID=UPI003A599C2C